MRRWPILVLLLVGCRPTVATAPASEPSAVTAAEEETGPTDVTTTEADTTAAEETPEPAPPSLQFVGDGWVRDIDVPWSPLLRLTTLRPSDADDARPVTALLELLGPLMSCYETTLRDEPELHATVWIRRRAPEDGDPEGFGLRVDGSGPNDIAACIEPLVRQLLPPPADDPHGRYAVSLFPHRDEAPLLRVPELADEVIEHDGGSCWTKRTFPCKPNKRRKAPDWERTQCHHPADLPGVALRWALGPIAESRQAITGLDLVAADGALIWRAPFEPDDVSRLGTMQVDDARAHVESFRQRALPGSRWVALEPKLVRIADLAGVRTYHRRSGELRFRYVPREPEAERLWFDGGTFVARHAKRRCVGDAGHGAFAARCGDDLLVFDGHAFAVISIERGTWLRAETTLSDPGSTRRGGAVNPTVSLRAGGYRLKVSGTVFIQ